MAAPSPAAAEQPVRNHHRSLSGPSKKKQHHTRSARPSVVRRDTSKTSLAKLGQPADRPKSAQRRDHDDDDNMSATFLQFCAVCEKQISVPSASVLYCSEACRKCDGHRSSEYPLFQTDMSPPSSPTRSHVLDADHPANIIPQRSPTSHASPFASHRTSLVHMSSDEDFAYDMRAPSRNASHTSLSNVGFSRSRPLLSRLDSDSAAALHQYQWASHGTRPSLVRNTPSLSHTPSSTVGTSTSYTPSPVNVMPHRQSLGRSFSRPSSMHFSSRSIDLVTPITIEQQKAYVSPSNVSAAAASDVTIRDQMDLLRMEGGDDIEHAVDDHDGYEKQSFRQPTSPRLTSTSSLQRLLQLEDARRLAASRR